MVKSHAGLRSSTVWGGSFPFLTLKDIHIHWFSIYLPRNLWAEETPLETMVPTSAWQCAPLFKPLIRNLVHVMVDCYQTKIPEQICPPTVLLLQLSPSLEQPCEWSVQSSIPTISWVISKKLCSEHLPNRRELQSGLSGLGYQVTEGTFFQTSGYLPKAWKLSEDTLLPQAPNRSPKGLPYCLMGLGNKERSQGRDHEP